jgi:hypothetical protein
VIFRAWHAIASSFIWFSLSTVSLAQDPARLAPSPNDNLTYAWLRTGDSRLVAWGAFYAMQSKENTLVSQLVSLANNWQSLPHDQNDYALSPLSESDFQRSEAMASVLDALIQTGASLPPETIRNLSADFPAQAMVLLVRMSWQDEQPVLLSLYKDPTPEDPYFLQHFAAAALAQRPPKGFAADLFASITVRATLIVISPGQQRLGIVFGPGSCGAGLEPHLPQGWPKINHYSLSNSSTAKMFDRTLLLVPGVRPIYGLRTTDSVGRCRNIGALTDEIRLALLAEMLEIKPAELGWVVNVQNNLVFESSPQYQKEIRSFVFDQGTKFRATALRLQEKGMLTSQEAGKAKPKLQLQVEDTREDKAVALPDISSEDPNVHLWVGDWGQAVPRMF